MLDRTTTYVVIGTNPPNHRTMKPGDVVGVRMCEPGGPEFRVSIRLSRIEPDGTFEGTTFALKQGQGQYVGGSFTNPALNTRR